MQLLVCFSGLLTLSSLVNARSHGGVTVGWKTPTSLWAIFPDNKHDTILLSLSSFYNRTTPCLFRGDLQSGEDATIAVSGCHNSSSTIVIISYKELLAEIIIGEDSAPENDQIEIDMGYALPPQEDLFPPGTLASFVGPLPSQVVVTTKIVYDRNLLDYFSRDHDQVKQWLHRVMDLSRPLLLHSSLDIKIELDIAGDYVYENVRIQADVPSLENLKYDVYPKYNNLIGAFTYSGQFGTVGMAWMGTACSTWGSAAGITELYREDNSEFHSARTYVHEVGHNLGMWHDFDSIHGGKDCDGQGLMSYGLTPDKWSSCSNEDFVDAYKRGLLYEGQRSTPLHECLKTGGGTRNPLAPPEGQRCSGRNYQGRNCCTRENPCDEGEGDCDWDIGCKGNLVCGHNNCKKFGLYFHEKDDCCETLTNEYEYDEDEDWDEYEY